jgi:hypothetical protein
MKKLIYGTLFLAIIGISITSCGKSPNNKTNQVVKKPNGTFNSEGLSLGKFDCPYAEKELNEIIKENQKKAAWPRIKVSATFGGFSNGSNNPCNGCDHCGCCVGLCIEISKGMLVYNPLTNEEIDDRNVLFDFVDMPSAEQIMLIPNQNMDNGDGWLHVDGDIPFSREISRFIGRPVSLKNGSYEIVYLPDYPFGVTVVRTN